MESTRNFGLNDKSNREGFDTSPCLPVARKDREPIPFSDALMFFSNVPAVYFKFVFFVVRRIAFKFEMVCDARDDRRVTYSRVGFYVLLLFYLHVALWDVFANVRSSS